MVKALLPLDSTRQSPATPDVRPHIKPSLQTNIPIPLIPSSYLVMSNTDSTYPEFSTLNARHHRLGAWFLGPKAENAQFLKDFFQYIAEQTENARKTFQPNDPVSRLSQ
jgi:hypothetical protein